VIKIDVVSAQRIPHVDHRECPDVTSLSQHHADIQSDVQSDGAIGAATSYKIGNMTFEVSPVFKERNEETISSILIKLIRSEFEFYWQR